ncbi:hypothetical protein ACI2IP_04855 [Microbacterium sp. NPDC090218]
MGLFQQKPEEEENQWVLPSEPLERSEAEVLGTTPAVDPLSLGLGFGATSSVSSIVFPVAPPPPDAVSAENDEPADGAGDDADAG